VRVIKDKTDNHLRLLADLFREFTKTPNLNQSLNRALADIVESVGAEAGSMFLIDAGKNKLVCMAAFGPVDVTGMELDIDQGVVGGVVTSRSPVLVDSTDENEQFTGHVDAVTGFTTRAMITAPLLAGDDCLGAIQLINPVPDDRKFTQADLEALRILSGAAGLALMNARLAKDMAEQDRLKREAQMARDVQESLTARNFDPTDRLVAVNLPAREVSGDFYCVMPMPDGSQYFCLADVSGKGAHAGILMARTATLFRMLAKLQTPLTEMLSTMNAELLETSFKGMFVTMVVGKTEGHHVSFTSAGHEPVLHYIGPGKHQTYPSKRPPLGISRWVSPPELTQLTIAEGGLYVYTDGVTDGLTRSGQPLELEGIISTLDEIAPLPPKVQVDVLAKRLDHGAPLKDDVTILAYKPNA
jgi:phosphoserine phosphatase RsbU/P